MADRKENTSEERAPLTRTISVEDLTDPNARPTELCERLEKLRDWMARSEFNNFLVTLYSHPQLPHQATSYSF